MSRLKLTVGAAAFAVALAVPTWAAAGPLVGSASPPAGTAANGVAAAPHAPKSAAPGASPSASPGGWKAMDKAMAARAKSFPAATKGRGGQLLAPKVLADGTKEFHLTAKIAKWEIEPGKIVDAWTYNGTVPGPTIHVNRGDKVRIVVKNELPESTSVHWHGLHVPNDMDGVSDLTQEPIKPGDTFTYAFTITQRVAVSWYHSHHNGTKQVSSGLSGAFLVGKMPVPAGVKVDQKVNLQLQDSGTIGMTINGKSFPATEPVKARKGDWVEVNYFNAGTMAHPMHLHGVDQLVIAKDGFPLKEPYLADTINVAPAERYTVLVHANALGSWAWHCHIFPHAEGPQGMFGLFTEMIISKDDRRH